ncbi:MAG: YidC/Oxa1 family membrane protein insertase [Clostridia bacterium]|jgi:YidC/Oxa1 family membrane protein insertase|nr:YidC/Oxa1 family membrane protein insertase [Clostridia bacterium]
MIKSLFGGLLNTIFEFTYNLSPVYNLGITIIIFTIMVKLILLPLAIKQQKEMVKLKKIQPEMKKIQDRYKGKKDQESQLKMNTELMELYKKHDTHPFGSCLPTLIQIPVIFGIFSVMRNANTFIGKLDVIYGSLTDGLMNLGLNLEMNGVTEMATKAFGNKTPDFTKMEDVRMFISKLGTEDWSTLMANIKPESVGNINELLAQKANMENFFGINLIESPNFAFPAVIIPIIAVIATVITMKLSANQNAMDEKAAEMNKTMMRVMPVMTFFIGNSLPTGLSLYFALSSTLQVVQQLVLNKFYKGDPSNE